MEDKTIALEQCATDNMVTDTLTKGLPVPVFETQGKNVRKKFQHIVGFRIVHYGIQAPNWIDSEYHKTVQICDMC